MHGNGIIKKLFFTTFSVQLISMLSGTINSIVDGMVIGKCLGMREMTAYGYVSPVIMIILALGVLVSAGTSGACGRIIGKGDKKEIINCFSSIFLTGVVLGVLGLLFLEICAGTIAGFLTGSAGGEADIYTKLVQKFLTGYGYNILPSLLIVHLTPIMQFDGNPRLSVAALTVMTVSNVSLDILNGLVFHQGMFGMAMATSLSSILALCIMLSNFFRKNHLMRLSPKGFQWQYVKMLFEYGTSASIMIFANTMTLFFLNRLLGRHVSKDAVAALAAVNSASVLCTSIGMALRITLVTLVSMFEGEQEQLRLLECHITPLAEILTLAIEDVRPYKCT